MKCHGSATNLLKRPTTEGLFCHLEALEFYWRVELGVWRGYRDQLRDSDQIVGEQVKHELGDHAGDAATSGAWCGAAWPQPSAIVRARGNTAALVVCLRRNLYAMLIVRDA